MNEMDEGAIDDEGSGVIGRADEATHPELLEGVRLPRGLPEEGDEVHAVALGLEVGHETRGVLHLLRRGCCRARGMGQGSVIRVMYEFQSRRVIVRLDPRGRRDAEDGRDRADDRSPGRCEEDAPFWSSPPSPGRAMSPASVGAYIAAGPTAFQKRAPFADPATRSRPIDRERGPSFFRLRALCLRKEPPPAGSLRSRLERGARVSLCRSTAQGNRVVWRQK